MTGLRLTIAAALLLMLFGAGSAHAAQLELNGIGVYEQAHADFFMGALYIGWPSEDPASIVDMPGRKHMDLHVATARWPRAQFSKQWNQLITINNSTAAINDNALDIMAFFDAVKGDLVMGDQMVVDLDSNNTTRIVLNGVSLLHTEGPGLFAVLFNSWAGSRPPSAEFKSGLLRIKKDNDSSKLIARFNALKPVESRSQEIARWRSGDTNGTVVATNLPAAASQPAQQSAPAVASAAPPKVLVPVVPASSAAVPQSASIALKPTTVAPAPAPAQVPAPTQASVAAPMHAPTPASPPSLAKPAAVVKAPAPQQTLAFAAASLPPSASDASAVDDTSARQKLLKNEYSRLVGARIKQNIAYPRRAIQNDIEGLVLVKITLDRGGNIADLTIAQSGEQVLDSAAERGARKAAPYPPPGDEMVGDRFDVAIPVVFKLEQ